MSCRVQKTLQAVVQTTRWEQINKKRTSQVFRSYWVTLNCRPGASTNNSIPTKPTLRRTTRNRFELWRNNSMKSLSRRDLSIALRCWKTQVNIKSYRVWKKKKRGPTNAHRLTCSKNTQPGWMRSRRTTMTSSRSKRTRSSSSRLKSRRWWMTTRRLWSRSSRMRTRSVKRLKRKTKTISVKYQIWASSQRLNFK